MNKIYTLLFVTLIVSCKTPDAFESIDPYAGDLTQTLRAYHELQTPARLTKAAAPAMYVDFSAGMNTAFGAPGIREMMSRCFNTVLAKQFNVFRLALGQVTPLEVSNPTELGQIVNDPKQYLDIRAPLQAAVEQIVAAKNDALLITDFEEWQNNVEVTGTAYLKIPFSKWLADGNSITFFTADYQEGKTSKHVYFTVFTYGRSQGNSLIDKLRPQLAALTQFDLARDAYALRTDYPGAKTGGIFYDLKGQDEQSRNVLDLQAGYIRGADFEYYPLGLDWGTIDASRKEYQQQGQFQELFRKLYLDLSHTDSYRYEKLEVETYDIAADFERYVRCQEVKKHQPTIVKGANGEDKISDQETDPIALSCYQADGQIKPAYRHEPAGQKLVNNAFTLNQRLFTNTLHTDPKKTEIGIAFAPQFNAAQIPGLIKITLVVADASVNRDNSQLDKFKWINRNGIENAGLYNSVKNTLEEMKPQHQTIYTYYLKTTEQN